jgi:hypothetical protein
MQLVLLHVTEPKHISLRLMYLTSSSTHPHKANSINEKAQHIAYCKRTSKNCPAEAPEGDSIQDLSALCNAADPE